MKITAVETIPVDRYLFVKVHTDEGIVGLGEVGTFAYLEACAQAVETFKRYLIGQDPLRIEHHWQSMYRWVHFHGAVVMGALSAIDIALWDIAGKRFGAPVYQLLGGKCRDRARVYCHVYGSTLEAQVKGCLEAKAQGFTAIGHLQPFQDEARTIPYFKTHVRKIADAIAAVGRYREAAGDDVDICIEVHRRLTPSEAIALARGIEQYHPLFYEDPTLPENFDAMALVANHINIPIATGERLHTTHEFRMLLERGAAQYVRPDLCTAGGLSHVKKIAALAETHYVGVVPHNPLGPVSLAACLQLAACIPNFTIQEYPLVFGEGVRHKEGIVKNPPTLENGFLVIPDVPGIGAELAEDVQERYPPRPYPLVIRQHVDGSMVDQ